MAERTFSVGTELLPVCARCTGSMISIFCGFVFLLVSKRTRGNKVFGTLPIIFMVIGISTLAIDGISTYIGLRETNNTIRLITGLCAGYAFPMFFTLIRNYDVKQKNDLPIIENIKDIAIIFALMILVSSLILIKNVAAWSALSVIITLSIFYFYINLCGLVVDFMCWLAKKKLNRTIKIILSTAMTIFFVAAMPQVIEYIKG